MKENDKLKQILWESETSDWLEKAALRAEQSGARKNARKVALNVLRILDEKNISQSQLAERMGVSRQQISKIVKGQENFTFETIDKLEKALGVSLMSIELKVPENKTAVSATINSVVVFYGGHFTFDPVIREIARVQMSKSWHIQYPAKPSMMLFPDQTMPGIPFQNQHLIPHPFLESAYSWIIPEGSMACITRLSTSEKKPAKAEPIQSSFVNV